MGLLGAFLMGGIVFFINLQHGWPLSFVAGLKQWVYTFLFGGMIIRMLEYMLQIEVNKYVSIAFSVLLISSTTSLLIYLIHSLKGTPEPFLSTLPTIIMAPPGFLLLAIKFKREQEINSRMHKRQ